MPVDAMAAATSLVQAYCGWHVAPVKTDDELTLDGPGRQLLLLPSLHVTAITSVVDDGVTLDPATEYEWSASGMVIRTSPDNRCIPFTRKFRSIVVTLTHGYETMPGDVQAVIERLASRGASNGGGYTQVGQVRVATGTDGAPLGLSLTDQDKADLGPYRLPPRP